MATFYMTLGSGQPHFPGYFTCEADIDEFGVHLEQQ